MNEITMCLLNTNYGNWFFKTAGAFIKFQETCPHHQIIHLHHKDHDYLICDRCIKIINETSPVVEGMVTD